MKHLPFISKKISVIKLISILMLMMVFTESQAQNYVVIATYKIGTWDAWTLKRADCEYTTEVKCVSEGLDVPTVGAYYTWNGSVFVSSNGYQNGGYGSPGNCTPVNVCNDVYVVVTNPGYGCSGSSVQLICDPYNTTGYVTYSWSGPNGFRSSSQNPTTAYGSGTYYVTITDQNGCTASGSTIVSVSSPPTPTVSNSTICTGQSATLTASNCAGTVTWNTGATGTTLTASPTSSTSYTATCTTAAGCAASAIGTITVIPAPVVSVSSVSICSGASGTLSMSGCTSGTVTWNTGATGTTLTASPTSSTSYTATCTTSSCARSAIGTITVTPAPAISVNSPNICLGETTTLQVTGCSGGNISWNTGATTASISVSPTASTSYTVTCTMNGCAAISKIGTVTVNPLPTLSITSSPCAADGLTYSVNFTTDAASVQSDKGVLSGNTVTGIPMGQIVTITASSSTGCKAVASASQNCTPSCVKPDAGIDLTICLPKSGVNLADAPTGYTWVASNTNPTAAIVNAQSGVATGMNTNGTYLFILQKIGDATCSDIVQVKVNNSADAVVLCNDGTTSYTIYAPTYLTNVIWYNMAGTQVGTGSTLVITSNTVGLSDGIEYYYYKGDFGTPNVCECDVELCCPVKITTRFCCPTPNCIDIKVTNN